MRKFCSFPVVFAMLCVVGSPATLTWAAPSSSLEATAPSKVRDLADFQVLTREMSPTKVHSLVGQPDSTTGSGLHIEVYNLPDKSAVWIGWTSPFDTSQLVYVKHRSQSGDKDLLPPK